MQGQSKGKLKLFVSIIVVIIFVPALIIFSEYFGDRKYYITSVAIMILAMVPFFVEFENRKPTARELVTIAVMSAVAVVSRAAFIMIPSFKPILGIVMICGMSLGAGSGFLIGAISAFVSNFIFGQGPWTPWQMFAFGIAGFIAGLLSKAKIMNENNRIRTAVIGALIILLIVGPILDTATLFTMATQVDKTTAAAVYMSGIPVNVIHSIAVFITMFFLCRPIYEKLWRIKVKYGMMEGGTDEV